MLQLVLAGIALFQSLGTPIPLDFLGLEHANRLDGRRVTVTLLVDTSPVTWDDKTVVGGAERPDEVSRTVILLGERYDVDEGDTVTITGKLRVIAHRADMVSGVFVPGWTEIRVEEE